MKVFLIGAVLSLAFSSCLTLEKPKQAKLILEVEKKVAPAVKQLLEGGAYYVTYENTDNLYGATYFLQRISLSEDIECGKSFSVMKMSKYNYCEFELKYDFKRIDAKKDLTEFHDIEIEEPHIKNLSRSFLNNISKNMGNFTQTDPLSAVRNTRGFNKFEKAVGGRKVVVGLPHVLAQALLRKKHKSVRRKIGTFGIKDLYDYGESGCLHVITDVVVAIEKSCKD